MRRGHAGSRRYEHKEALWSALADGYTAGVSWFACCDCLSGLMSHWGLQRCIYGRGCIVCQEEQTDGGQRLPLESSSSALLLYIQSYIQFYPPSRRQRLHPPFHTRVESMTSLQEAVITIRKLCRRESESAATVQAAMQAATEVAQPPTRVATQAAQGSPGFCVVELLPERYHFRLAKRTTPLKHRQDQPLQRPTVNLPWCNAGRSPTQRARALHQSPNDAPPERVHRTCLTLAYQARLYLRSYIGVVSQQAKPVAEQGHPYTYLYTRQFTADQPSEHRTVSVSTRYDVLPAIFSRAICRSSHEGLQGGCRLLRQRLCTNVSKRSR